MITYINKGNGVGMRLKELCQLRGVSGDEKEVHDFLYDEYKKRNLPIIKDRLGSVFGIKKGKDSSYKIMISSNMDESGGMISDIREDGLMEFLTIGLYEKSLFEQRTVKVLNRRHEEYTGFIVKNENELLLDTGYGNKEEVLKAGIQIGDIFLLDVPTLCLPEGEILSKNLSNRAGLEVGLAVLDKLEEGRENLLFDVAVGGISHSVTGQRGAITATTAVKPDIAIVIDATYVKEPKENAVYIRSFDKSMLPNQMLKQEFYEAAQKKGYIPEGHVQLEATDGSFIHKSLEGTPAVVLVLPLKHKQALLNSLKVKHINNLSDVIIEFIKGLTAEKIEKFGFKG